LGQIEELDKLDIDSSLDDVRKSDRMKLLSRLNLLRKILF